MPLLINNQFSCSQESWLNQKLVIQSKKKQFATVADPRFLFKTRISSRVRFFVRIIVDETFYRGNRFKWHGTDTQRRTFCVGSSGRQAAKKGRTKRKEQSRPHPWPGSQPSRNRVTLSKAISETEIVVGGVAAVDATTQLKTHRADGRRTDRFRRNFFIKSAATAWKGVGGGGGASGGGGKRVGWKFLLLHPPSLPSTHPILFSLIGEIRRRESLLPWQRALSVLTEFYCVQPASTDSYRIFVYGVVDCVYRVQLCWAVFLYLCICNCARRVYWVVLKWITFIR